MGVMNITPDSFYRPSRLESASEAYARGLLLKVEGADIVDVGGESSRPGSEPVGGEVERERVLPILEAIRELEVQISIDTWRAETARQAVARGATMVNDITALRGEPEMAEVVASSGVECVLMHMLGTPHTMQRHPAYNDVVDDICRFFEERIEWATSRGIREDRLWLDPGFGFGKTVRHNLTLLRRLGEFRRFGLAIMIGTSNKSTIGAVLDAPVNGRLEGTAATVAIAIANGADCVRVHDVRSMARVARMSDAICRTDLTGDSGVASSDIAERG